MATIHREKQVLLSSISVLEILDLALLHLHVFIQAQTQLNLL